MKITIYSTTTCPYCKMLKKYLQDHNIAFSEKMVDIDSAARDEMAAHSDGFLGVPFTLVERDGKEVEKIVGFDKGRVNQVLGI